MLPNNKNFRKIQKQHLTGTSTTKHFIKVDGFTNANVKIFEEGPRQVSNGNSPPFIQSCPGCEPYIDACKWKCNGTTYAWEISQAIKPDGGNSIFSLYSTFDYFDTVNQIATPYYNYMSSSVFFNSYCPSMEWTSFTNTCGTSQNTNNITIIGPLNGTIQTQYFGAGGSLLLGPVYGVMKTLGPWEESIIQTPPLLFSSPECFNDRFWAINIMNTYGDFSRIGEPDYPALNCFPAYSIPDNINSSLDNGGNAGINCISTTFTNFNFGPKEDGFDGDFFDLMTQIDECYALNNIISCCNSLKEVRINDLNDNGFTPIVIKSIPNANANPIAIVKVNRKFTGQSFTLNPSLYVMGVVFTDGKYMPLVKELTTVLQNDPKPEREKMANFLDAVIIPVPIISSQFELKMKANNAALKFDYVLESFNSNELHRQNFMLHKDQEITSTIIPVNVMPPGLLFHKFVFQDGSIKTIQTIKN